MMKIRLGTSIRSRGIVPYHVSSMLRIQSKAIKAIDNAIADYQKHTKVYSTQRTQKLHRILRSCWCMVGGCIFLVGMWGGRRGISLGGRCWSKDTTTHEIKDISQ